MRQRTHFATAMLFLGLAGLASACSSPAPAPAPKEQPAAPKPITADERVKWYQGCWDAFNQKKMAELKQCYAGNATALDGAGKTVTGPDAIIASAEDFVKTFPDVRGDGQLILSNGTHIAGVYLLTGTNSGTSKTPDGKEAPPTNKKIGLLFGHEIDSHPSTLKVTREFGVNDNATLANQIGVSKSPGRPLMAKGEASPKIVIAKSDATETKNLDVEKAQLDAWNKHDLNAVYAAVADDFVAHDMTETKDRNKMQNSDTDKAFWKAFSDAHLTPSSMWAAGDYVVSVGTFDGTNDGDMPPMIKKTGKKVTVPYLSIDRLEDGKIKEGWLFYDGAAFGAQLGMK